MKKQFTQEVYDKFFSSPLELSKNVTYKEYYNKVNFLFKDYDVILENLSKFNSSAKVSGIKVFNNRGQVWILKVKIVDVEVKEIEDSPLPVKKSWWKFWK